MWLILSHEVLFTFNGEWMIHIDPLFKWFTIGSSLHMNSAVHPALVAVVTPWSRNPVTTAPASAREPRSRTALAGRHGSKQLRALGPSGAAAAAYCERGARWPGEATGGPWWIAVVIRCSHPVGVGVMAITVLMCVLSCMASLTLDSEHSH